MRQLFTYRFVILMNTLKKLLVATAVVVFSGLTAVETAQAITLSETTDAGDTLGTATAANTQPAGTLLASISGLISEEDADLYQIFLTGRQIFSATTENGASFDTQLFLFDANGFGVEANDDTDNSSYQSTLPEGNLSPTTSGIYYLGISGNNYDPVSEGGLIFSDSLIAVAGPTGPGGASPLSSFASDGFPTDSGEYTISLTGAQFVDATPVPFGFSPGMGILVLGAWNVIARLKSQKYHRSSATTSKKFRKILQTNFSTSI